MDRDWLGVGDPVWAKVMEDKSKGVGFWKTVEAMDQTRWDEDQARKTAQEAMEIAAKASEIALQSAEKSKQMMEIAEDARMKIKGQNLGMNIGCPPGIFARDSDPRVIGDIHFGSWNTAYSIWGSNF